MTSCHCFKMMVRKPIMMILLRRFISLIALSIFTFEASLIFALPDDNLIQPPERHAFSDRFKGPPPQFVRKLQQSGALPTSWQIINTNSNFSVFATELSAVHYDSLLNTSTGSSTAGLFTTFVPYDSAMLSTKGLNNILTNPQFTLHLQNFVGFYIATNGALNLSNLTSGRQLSMLNGETLSVLMAENVVSLFSQHGAFAQVQPLDMMASNGVVHPLDAVLLPAFMFQSLYDLAGTAMQQLAVKAGLDQQLKNGTYTLILPSAQALASLPSSVSNDPSQLRNVLLLHIIPQVLSTPELLALGRVPSAQGTNLDVASQNSFTVTINGIPITSSNILANNGIVQQVDQLLTLPIGAPTLPPIPLPPTPAPVVPQYTAAASEQAGSPPLVVVGSRMPVAYQIVGPTITPWGARAPALPPNTPSAPSYPSYPSMPSNPAMPLYPSMPSYPIMPSYPTMPTYPATPSYPSMPSNPSMPAIPTVPSYPSMPSNPTLPPTVGTSLSTVANTLASDPNVSTFVVLLKAANLYPRFDTSTTSTMFAPENYAFQAIDQTLLSNLLQPEYTVHLQSLLGLHATSPQVLTSNQLVSNMGLHMMNGDFVEVYVGSLGNIFLLDPDGTGGTVVEPDVVASNGIIHHLDTVLFPYFVNHDIISVLEAMGGFSILTNWLQKANLATLMNSGTFTFLAANDTAIAAAGSSVITDLNTNLDHLTSWLKYNLIEGLLPSGMRNSGPQQTVQGTDVVVTVVNPQTASINGISVLSNAPASNGIIYVMNAMVMLPAGSTDGPTLAPTPAKPSPATTVPVLPPVYIPIATNPTITPGIPAPVPGMPTNVIPTMTPGVPSPGAPTHVPGIPTFTFSPKPAGMSNTFSPKPAAAATFSPKPVAATFSPRPVAPTASPKPVAATYSPKPVAATSSPTLTSPSSKAASSSPTAAPAPAPTSATSAANDIVSRRRSKQVAWSVLSAALASYISAMILA